MPDQQTLAVYAARARDYAQRFSQDRPDRHLAAFIAALPKGAKVLDLGCGTGRAAAFMRDAGLTVDAWDASPEMADLARDLHGIDVTLAAFDALGAKAAYDAIYANFSLLHAPRADMPDNLARIRAALKVGGLFHLGLKTGDGETRDALGRFYAYYQDPELTQLLQGSGFTVLSRDFGAEEGLDGTLAPYVIIKARA
jgi:SAM-dependent methyltransferase